MIVWQDVVNVAPELSTINEDSQEAILAQVDLLCHVDAWGDLRDTGMAYLAAHCATVSTRRGAGPVIAESVGQLSRQYGSLVSVGALGSSAYGLEYLRLMKLLPTSLGAVF